VPVWLFVALLACLAAAGALAIGLLKERRRAKRAESRALTDPLTGLANRLRFEVTATNFWASAERFGRPLGVLVLDLDGFKHLNDTSGHAAGDRLLREVAAALTSRVRQTDLVARLGGDEFAVLAPETPPEGLLQLATSFEAAIEALPVGVSVGWALREPGDLGLDDVLARADAAMYQRKRQRALTWSISRSQPTVQLSPDASVT